MAATPRSPRRIEDELRKIEQGYREIEMRAEGRNKDSAKLNAMHAFREQYRVSGRVSISHPMLISRKPPTRTVTEPVTQPDGQVIIVATEQDDPEAPAEEWTETWLFAIRYKG